MSFVATTFFSWLIKSVLSYTSRWTWTKALPYWKRFSEKRMGFEDPKDVLAAVAANQVEEGTLVEVPGLLSKFTFEYQPFASAPYYLASTPHDFSDQEIGGGQFKADIQKALAACGENPTFSDGNKLFYLYRPVFKQFPSRFNSDDAEKVIEKYNSIYARIPVIGNADLIRHAEKRNHIVGRASYLPYEVMAEIYGVTREHYEHLSATGKNFALYVTEDLRGDIKLEPALDKLQDKLWVGLFAEFLFEPVTMPGMPSYMALLERLMKLFETTSRLVLPEAGIKLKGDLPEEVTRAISRMDFYTVGMNAWTITPLYAILRMPGAIGLHMASDVRRDPIHDEEVFYRWVALVAKDLPQILSEIAERPISIELNFVSQFGRSRSLGLHVLEKGSVDEVAQSEAFRHTVAWLRSGK